MDKKPTAPVNPPKNREDFFAMVSPMQAQKTHESLDPSNEAVLTNKVNDYAPASVLDKPVQVGLADSEHRSLSYATPKNSKELRDSHQIGVD